MCKHVVNAQCMFQAPCCHRWFDCSECHFELSDHTIIAATELAFMCKKCRNPFRKDMLHFGVEDEQCPHCGNQFVLQAEQPDQTLAPQ